MVKRLKGVILLFLCFMSCFEVMAKPSVTIKTNLSNGQVSQGETFNIIIRADNTPGDLQINSDVPGCKIVYSFPSKGESWSSDGRNSVHEQYTSVTLTCKAVNPGKYTFGPVKVGNLSSNKISYEIVSGSSQTKGKQTGNQNGNQNVGPGTNNHNGGPVFVGRGNEEMFLRASVSKSNVYEQEAIAYTVKLYSTYEDIRFIGAAAAPKFEGFLMEESDDVSTSLSFETYNGKIYKTAVIVRYIIFPQKAGRLKIRGNTYTVSTTRYNYYYDPYFSNMIQRDPVQLNITPNDIEINVKPLPGPIPTDFMGAVGTDFAITSDMPNTSLQTNSGASLIYHVTGTGNIKYVTLPEISTSFPKSIEVYSPKVTTDTKVGSDNVSGSVNFDYLIMPMEEGDFSIPALEFSYFNPDEGVYKKIRSKGFEVKVGVGNASDKSQQAVNFNPTLMAAGKLKPSQKKPYISGFLYWLWYIVPIVIYVISLSWYRRYLSDHEDIQLLRSKQANKMALRRLKTAYQCLTAKKENEFYDAMLAALWGYIGDKLKMPTSELTRSNVGEEFKTHGIKESTFQPIINLIDECEYAKYTPVSRDANMRQLYADAVKHLAEVESEFSQNKTNKTTSGESGVNEDDDEKYN